MDRAVHLRGAVCLLNRFPALAGVDLDVARGEVLLVTGPNGAGLYDDLTVAENARFWARAARSGADVDDVLGRAGVDGRVRDVVAARLSAGQRRRASLAVLLARRPQLWLLDEPHAGLDAAGRDRLDGEIRAATAAGATVIVASHELDRAGVLATRTVTVAGGQIAVGAREAVDVA